MHITVYIDVYFGINFCVDFILLLAEGKWIRRRLSFIRISLAALLGAFLSCCLMLIGKRGTGMLFLEAFVLVWIAFGYHSMMGLLLETAKFLLLAFLFSGFLNFILEGTGEKITAAWILFWSFFLFVLSTSAGMLMKVKKRRREFYYEIRIFHSEKERRGTAFWDTGNHLRDTFSGKPVLLAEYEWIKPVFSGEEQKQIENWLERGEYPKGQKAGMFRVIPYHSVGQPDGMLLGVELEKAGIRELDGDRHEKGWEIRKSILIALTWQKLSSGESYQVLLPTQFLEYPA